MQAKLYKNARNNRFCAYLYSSHLVINFTFKNVMKEEIVIRNIIQIRELKGFTKRDMADRLSMNEASYGRIESGKISLSYSHLASIASVFGMSVIDVITYPKIFVELTEKIDGEVEAVLQIKLKNKIKDEVLRLVLGDNNIEILNR